MLGAQAFRMVGDFSPEHRVATLGPTLLRFYVSSDGVTCASSYCTEPQVHGWFTKLLLKLRGKWKQTAITECESAFDDGSFLITTNAPTVTPFLTRGDVERVQLAAGTPPPAVYSRHRARIERYRRDHLHATAERVDTDERIFELQRRISVAKAAYRLKIGYVDDKELRHLLGEDYDYLAQKIRVKLAQIVAAAGE